MALIEQQLAADLVDLRLQMSLGTEYVRAVDLERALQRHLDHEQGWRLVIAANAAMVGYTPKVET